MGSTSLLEKKLGYFGYGGQGKQVRDVLHINDLSMLVDFQIHNIDKVNGRIMNVGGGEKISASLKELTTICQIVTGNKIEIEEVKENRQADIRVYITDNSLVSSATGWQPQSSVEELVRDVYKWIRENEKTLKPIFET